MTEFIVRMNDFQVIYTIYTKGLKFHMTERLVFYFLLTWLYTSFISFHLFITFLAEPRFRSYNLGLFLIFGLVTWRWIPWSMVSWYGPSLFPTLGPILSPVLYTIVRSFSPVGYLSRESSCGFSWTYCISILTSWTPPAFSPCSPCTPPFTSSQALTFFLGDTSHLYYLETLHNFYFFETFLLVSFQFAFSHHFYWDTL